MPLGAAWALGAVLGPDPMFEPSAERPSDLMVLSLAMIASSLASRPGAMFMFMVIGLDVILPTALLNMLTLLLSVFRIDAVALSGATACSHCLSADTELPVVTWTSYLTS